MVHRVRLIAAGDEGELASALVRNRSFLAPWDPVRADEYFTVSGQRAIIESALQRHSRDDSVPLVILDDDARIAGRVTLSGIVRGAFYSCSIGYWLRKDRTGRGFATQAVDAAVSIAFDDLHLHRVQAEILPSNASSRRVLDRTGFVQYGLAPRYLKIAGRWQDHVLFQRLNESL